MATVTPNLGLTLPIGSEKVSRSIINGNMSIIDTFCGDINKSTLRDVPFAIAVNDWTSVNGQWVAEFTTAYVTATSKEIGYYNKSIVDYAKAHILMEKKSGGGGLVFTTAKKPTGLIEGTVLVFDNDDLKLPVLIEDTVVSIANGGTGANTLAGAKQTLGITALADQIAKSNVTLTAGTKCSIQVQNSFKCNNILYINLMLSVDTALSQNDPLFELPSGMSFIKRCDFQLYNGNMIVGLPNSNSIFCTTGTIPTGSYIVSFCALVN